MPNRITPSNAQTALVDLELNAVALCGEGANSRADIILTKRKESETMPKTFEELMAALQPEQAEVVTKHIGSLNDNNAAEIQKLNDKINELTEQLNKATTPAEPATGTDVLKGVSPEVMELFKKQQATIDSLQAAQAEELAKSRFEKCKAIPCDEAELKNVLKSASPAAVAVLEKAAAAIEQGLLTAKGRNMDPAFTGTSADDMYGKLEKRANEIVAADSTVSFEKAFTVACTEDPETYRKYVEGVR